MKASISNILGETQKKVKLFRKDVDGVCVRVQKDQSRKNTVQGLAGIKSSRIDGN